MKTQGWTDNFFLVGVGGQGILLAADVIALVGMEAGYDVKKSEVHGMAQRGGSVTSHVRWGERVYSPLISPGEVDYLLAFERLEGLRHAEMLRPGGVMLVNDYRIIPVSVSAGGSHYPSAEEEEGIYREAGLHPYYIPAIEIAQTLGNARVNNIVMLGALAALLEVPPELWRQVIAQRVPERYREINLEGFAQGYDYLAKLRGRK